MYYTTIYDLAAQPLLNWRTLVLPLGLALAASAWAYYSPSGFGRSALAAFALIAVLVSVGIPAYDYYQLSHKKPSVVAGVVADYWEKEWTTRRDSKNQRHSYEGFRVGTVPFGYFRNVGMAGFTNTEPNQFPLQNGLAMRVHYVPERQLDNGTIINRILKLEVAD